MCQVRAAPWNTTHHFINASKGKYQLSVSGPADPTGCGEGFSYTRLNSKVCWLVMSACGLACASFCIQRDTTTSLPASKKYKNVMGTDGDLRKLKLSKAKSLLRSFGVSEDVVRRELFEVYQKVRARAITIFCSFYRLQSCHVGKS